MISSAIANVRLGRSTQDPLATDCDCLVVAVGDNGASCSVAETLNARTEGWVRRAIESRIIKTGLFDFSLVPFPLVPGGATPAPHAILFAGMGDIVKITRGDVFDWGAAVVRRLMDVPRERIVISADIISLLKVDDALVAGAISGCEAQSICMSEPKTHVPAHLDFTRLSDESIAAGRVLGDSINLVRRWINEPPNHMYPESFADAATHVANEVGLDVTVWDEQRLLAEGCRAMLAVGAGSHRPPRLVMLRYQGTDESVAPIAIVGKGVTFDSGGLSIKPTDGMLDMKCDMAGAATVVGVMRAIALLKPAVNVVGLCGLAENMISGTAFKLGDVFEARNGTTIEIQNTDAEGRVVLADVLDVAVQMKPSAIVDLATLTGACMVALGREVCGLMTNDQSLCDELKASANRQGELVWQLPMFDFYGDHIKSKVADIKNTGDARWGGAITAAKFLQRFVDEKPWVHIDIAGPAYMDSAKPYRDAGGTGVMLRTLVGWLHSRATGKPQG